MIDFYSIDYFFILLVVSFSLWVAFLVLFSNKKAKLNQTFFWMTISILLWVVFVFFASLPSQMSHALLWRRLSFGASSLFIIPAYYLFVVYFSKKTKISLALGRIVMLVMLFFSFISIFTNLIVKDIQIVEWGIDIIFGKGIIYLYGVMFFVTCVIVFYLVRKYFKVPKKEKLKTQYFLIGVFIFIFFNIVFNVILPAISKSVRYYQFGDYSTIFLIGFTAYAIVKHELLGIKTLITQVLIVIISIILLLDVFLLSDDITMQLLKAGILITFLYFSRELVKSVRKEKEAVRELKLAYRKINHYTKRLEKGNKELEDANQRFKELLEMKNEFLHITSHQLRTPLTAIRGMIAMWYDGDFENLPKKEKKKMIKRILVSTERLNNITNDMLDALELEGGFLKFQFKPVSVAKIIKETINTLKPNFDKKNIYIKLETNLKVSDVEVEPNYIRQVFMNVIDNACKYTKKGGVSVNIKKENKYIKVIIKDTGIGISKTDQKKIFEKFTRGRNAINENASGSGLGLFIARKIVNSHGGKIEIESDGVGKGTAVKIFLKIKHSK